MDCASWLGGCCCEEEEDDDDMAGGEFGAAGRVEGWGVVKRKRCELVGFAAG